VANGLADTFGWRAAYKIIGLATLGFVVLWQVVAADEPARCRFISDAELRFLGEHVPKVSPARERADTGKDRAAEDDKTESTGWLGLPVRLALHPGLWAVFWAHIAFNFGAYYLTNWSPTYYAEVLGVPPAQAKLHLMLPHVSNLVTKALNPVLVALAQRRGFSLLGSRQLFTVTGFVAAALALLPVHQLRGRSPWWSTALFSLANASFGLTPSGFKANYLDVTERYVGVISGYGNTLGTVASWAGPQLTALVLATVGSWDAVLFCIATVNCLAALNYYRHATVSPIERAAAGVEMAPVFAKHS